MEWYWRFSGTKTAWKNFIFRIKPFPRIDPPQTEWMACCFFWRGRKFTFLPAITILEKTEDSQVSWLQICCFFSSKNQLEPPTNVCSWMIRRGMDCKWLGYKSATPIPKSVVPPFLFSVGPLFFLPLAKKMLVIAKLNYHSGIVNGFNDREFWREPVLLPLFRDVSCFKKAFLRKTFERDC